MTKIDVYALLPDHVKDYIAEEISEALAKNNIEAKSQKQYIKALKEQYLDLYNVYLKDYEISNIQEA